MKQTVQLLLTFLVVLHSSNGEIPKEDFFPFGDEIGDLRVTNGVDYFITAEFTNGRKFPFFSAEYEKLFLSTNAAITFVTGNLVFTPSCGSMTQPMILPYWADVNTALGGVVYYREADDPELLTKAKTDINLIYPNTNLELDWLFIITWDDVAFFGSEPPSEDCEGSNKRNTYQAILATDGAYSFATFYYNEITWTTGTMSGANGCDGLGGSAAKAGFDFGDQETFYEVAGSCTDEVINITQSTNVGQPGKWVFKIDKQSDLPSTTTKAPSTEPAATCNVDCSLQMYHPDPESCESFYQCSNGVPYFQPCPTGLVFNPNINVCDWPHNHHCSDPPGC